MMGQSNASTNDFSLNIEKRSSPMITHTMVRTRITQNLWFLTAPQTAGRSNHSTEANTCVHLFSRLPHDVNDIFTNIFSVPSPNQRSLRSRVIVTHVGQDSGSGTWRCSKDSPSNCLHITTACDFLRKIIQADPSTQNMLGMNAPLINAGKTCVVPCRVRGTHSAV